MTFYVENETDKNLPFDAEQVARSVVEAALDQEGCPYEVSLELLITDNDRIQKINKEFREIDRATDVLSFPNVDYDTPSDFSHLEEAAEDYFDLETGELCLGNIIISIDKVYEQAESYGHDEKREFAFLVAHSMLHLCGYDHMEPEEAKEMEAKQEEILTKLGITR